MGRPRVRFACTECKRTMTGSPGDEHRRSCETCHGQLVPIRFGPRRKRTRRT